MGKMSGVNRLPSEWYECPSCEQTYDDDEVKDTWRCPECGGYIYVHGEDVETGTRIVLIRKLAKDVEYGDLVHPVGMLTENCFMVLGVNKLSNGKLGLGLKGYTQYKVSPDEPVNIRVGAW